MKVGRHYWSFMEQTQGFGCISSENSDRTLQGVITHDGMVYIKFAKIMFSEQLEENSLTHLHSTSNQLRYVMFTVWIHMWLDSYI